MNYAWSADGYFGDIFETDKPADDVYVFATFRAARAGLAKHFDETARSYRDAARDARRTDKSGFRLEV